MTQAIASKSTHKARDPIRPAPPAPSAGHSQAFDAAEQAGYLLQLTTGTMEELMVHCGGDLGHAAHRMLVFSKIEVGKVNAQNLSREIDIDWLVEDASNALAQALAVLNALCLVEEGNVTLQSVVELTRLAKEKIDDVPLMGGQ